ncbi:MAG: DUF5947 family protein [Frankiaceae bacterium]
MTGEPTVALPDGVARLLRRRPPPPPGERCDMCSEQIGGEHPHVVDVTSRRIMCCCRACGMLFTDGAAAGGRYRTVPDRWLHDPQHQLSVEEWERFRIPVRVAFFFLNSSLDRVVALYPGPGGATESELALDAWDDLLAATPLAGMLAPDVEALLVDRGADRRAGRAQAGEQEPSCHLVPIDACYELVGRLRTKWAGFDGGEEARDELARFFATVHERSRPVRVPAG